MKSRYRQACRDLSRFTLIDQILFVRRNFVGILPFIDRTFPKARACYRYRYLMAQRTFVIGWWDTASCACAASCAACRRVVPEARYCWTTRWKISIAKTRLMCNKYIYRNRQKYSLFCEESLYLPKNSPKGKHSIEAAGSALML